jgi:hypothetical protein
MTELRETLPTISGSGAFAVSLILFALIFASDESRNLAFNWQFTIALVAISFPISFFINQIHHSIFIFFGFQRKDSYKTFSIDKKSYIKLDVMLDYLAFRDGKGDKGWSIIQKRALGYHLFSTLKEVSLFFIVCYSIFLFWNYFYGDIEILLLGAIFVYFIVTVCVFLFWYTCDRIWDIWMLLDKKVVKDYKNEIRKWCNDIGLK